MNLSELTNKLLRTLASLVGKPVGTLARDMSVGMIDLSSQILFVIEGRDLEWLHPYSLSRRWGIGSPHCVIL